MTVISERVTNRNSIVAKPIKAITALTATLVSTVIATAPALADEYKFSPGSMCQHSTPSDLPKLVRGENYIYNSDTSNYAYVACPIEWGVPDDSKNRGPYVNINVLKYNSQQLTCRLSTAYGTGGNIDSKSVSTTATGYTSLTTSRVKSGIVYGIFCNLPPSSGIWSIYTWF